MSRAKRVLVVSDLHCGHKAGLLPPWHVIRDGYEAEDSHMVAMQDELWGNWKQNLREYGPFDVCIVNGDCIEGRAEKSGGTELVTTEQLKQVKLANYCLERVDAEKFYFTYGTGYHASHAGEDYEKLIADNFDAPIKAKLWLDIEGVVFDVKHHIASSALPYSRHTAVSRERIQSMLWAEAGEPRGNVFIRSHVHYFNYCGGIEGDRSWLAMTTPALQAANTKYGGRRCSGVVDWGMVVFDVKDGAIERWTPVVTVIKSCLSKAIKV